MKSQPKLAEMIRSQTFDGFLYVKSSTLKPRDNGKKYLDMELADASKTVRAKMWDDIPGLPKEGSIIHVRAEMTEYNAQPQLKVKKMRPAAENDDYDAELLIPHEQTESSPLNETTVPAATVELKKAIPLSSLQDGDRYEGYLMVRAVDQRTDKNNKVYLDMTLCDASATINAKAFAKALGNQKAPSVGSVLYITGIKQIYNNTHVQLIIDIMRPTTEQDQVDLTSLIACAPYPIEKMKSIIFDRANSIKSDALKQLVLTRLDMCGERLDYYPAASKLHHAERSGLLHHTSTMLRMAEYVCLVYPHLDADLVAAGVILHDLCKLDEMDSDSIGVVADYTAKGNLIGHLVAGVAEIDRLGRALNTPAELLMMVEHMILSHHDLPEYGSPKPPMFPEAEVLHTLDLLDARMYEMTTELKSAVPGGFTERIWSLERKLYRRKDPS